MVAVATAVYAVDTIPVIFALALGLMGYKSNVTWYFRGQTKEKICQCEKKRSTLSILSKRNDDLIVMQNVRFFFRH